MASQSELQMMLLQARHTDGNRKERSSLFGRVSAGFADGSGPPDLELDQALWRLVSLGLAFPVFESVSPISVYLTPGGKAVATTSDATPDFPPQYLARLTARIPGVSAEVLRYVKEALRAYEVTAYLAATVMLGVASEGAMLQMAEKLAEWLDHRFGQKQLKQLLGKKKTSYLHVLSEARSRLASHEEELPGDLADTLPAKLAVADVLRGYRNDAGHPTGKEPSKEDCYDLFLVIPGYLERIGALGGFFAGQTQ